MALCADVGGVTRPSASGETSDPLVDTGTVTGPPPLVPGITVRVVVSGDTVAPPDGVLVGGSPLVASADSNTPVGERWSLRPSGNSAYERLEDKREIRGQGGADIRWASACSETVERGRESWNRGPNELRVGARAQGRQGGSGGTDAPTSTASRPDTRSSRGAVASVMLAPTSTAGSPAGAPARGRTMGGATPEVRVATLLTGVTALTAVSGVMADAPRTDSTSTPAATKVAPSSEKVLLDPRSVARGVRMVGRSGVTLLSDTYGLVSATRPMNSGAMSQDAPTDP